MAKIGTIIANIDRQLAAAVGSVVTVAGANRDARTGEQLIVPSLIDEVHMAVKERVVDQASGRVRTVPEEDNWTTLYRDEYDMFEELQDADETSTVKYTFRYQPTRERLPLFPEIGVYELWFQFIPKNTEQDHIRLTFEVEVGDPVSPRREESEGSEKLPDAIGHETGPLGGLSANFAARSVAGLLFVPRRGNRS